MLGVIYTSFSLTPDPRMLQDRLKDPACILTNIDSRMMIFTYCWQLLIQHSCLYQTITWINLLTVNLHEYLTYTTPFNHEFLTYTTPFKQTQMAVIISFTFIHRFRHLLHLIQPKIHKSQTRERLVKHHYFSPSQRQTSLPV